MTEYIKNGNALTFKWLALLLVAAVISLIGAWASGVAGRVQNLEEARTQSVERVSGLEANVTAVDKQGMASTQKRFDLGQQGDVGHGVFLVVNKRKP